MRCHSYGRTQQGGGVVETIMAIGNAGKDNTGWTDYTTSRRVEWFAKLFLHGIWNAHSYPALRKSSSFCYSSNITGWIMIFAIRRCRKISLSKYVWVYKAYVVEVYIVSTACIWLCSFTVWVYPLLNLLNGVVCPVSHHVLFGRLGIRKMKKWAVTNRGRVSCFFLKHIPCTVADFYNNY